MPTHKIEGQVVNKATNENITDVTVTVTFQYNNQSLSTQEAAVESDATFRITFDGSLWLNLPADARFVARFQVKDASGELLPTDFSIPDLKPGDYRVTVPVEVNEPLRQVSGTVRLADGTLATNMRVAAYDRDMRSEQLLGENQTNRKGYYLVRYQSSQFRRAEKEAADLVVKVFSPEGTELAASAIRFNAGLAETIDLTILPERYRGPSEHERYLHDTEPLLEDLTIIQLSDEDLDFLSHEAGIPLVHLQHLRQDAQWSLLHNVAPAIFYGLLRQNLPTDLRRLLSEKPSRLKPALQKSLADNLIPAVLAPQLDAIMDQLRKLALSLAFEPETDANQPPPIGVLLSTAPLAPAIRQQVADFVLQYEADGDFWEALATQGQIEEKELKTVRFTLESSSLLLDHMPTLQEVQTLRQEKSWTDSRGLAQLKRSDWRAVAKKTTTAGLPPGFESYEAYAEAIADRVEQAFPTAVVAHRLAEDPVLSNNDVNYFFRANPAFDLLQTPVESYLKKEADLGQIRDREGLSGKLKAFQRVARLTPDKNRFGLMQGLLRHGYDSALSIKNTNPDEFLTHIVPIAGTTTANDILVHAKARADAANIQGLAVQDYFRDGLFVLPHAKPSGELPTWTKLFGSLSSCSCQHCRSVYSPAAYLVDLLQFLKKAPRSGDGRPIREVLTGRRPDLVQLLLNCANANTPLPYIDLVNELLELQVSPVTAPAEQPYYQTIGSSKDDKAKLRAMPAHVHFPAYETLSIARYPWILPFDLQHEEIKSYAQLAGVALYELFELAGIQVGRIAQAHLGLSLNTWRLILTQMTSDTDLAGVWGISGAADLAILHQVPEVLTRANLSYAELEHLIASRFFAGYRLSIHRGNDPCDLSDDQLMYQPAPDGALLPLDTDTEKRAEIFDLIHRFIRLQRVLGWTKEKLSEVLTGRGLITSGPEPSWMRRIDLLDLSQTIRLADRLRMPVEDMAWLKDQRKLAQALRISEAELASFFALSGTSPFAGNPDDPLNLDLLETSLNQYHIVKASGFDLAELLYLLRHKDLIPAVFEPTAAMGAASLQNLYEAMRRSDLDFPVTGMDLVADASRIAVDNAASLFEGLLAEMNEVERNTQVSAYRSAITARFDSLFGAARSGLESGQGARVASGMALLEFESTIVPAYETAVAGYVPPLPATLTPAVRITTVASFRSRFTDTFSREQVKWQKLLQAVVDHLASAVSLSPEMMRTILLPETNEDGLVLAEAMLQAILAGGELPGAAPAIENFLAFIRRQGDAPLPALADEALPAVRRAAYHMFVRLTKSARLLQLLTITPEELKFIRDHGTAMGFADFNKLPVREGSGPALTELLVLARVKAIQGQLPAADETLFGFLELALRPDASLEGPGSLLATIAGNTGWNQDPQSGGEAAGMLESLNATFGFTIADYRNPETYARLKNAIDWIRRRGIPLSTWQNWVAEPAVPDSDLRNSLEQAARNRYANDSDWYQALTPIQDRLRERRRDALVAYLVGNRGWKDANSLYGHFLIDVEMSACQLSSRILQANSTIQLFVQRCLMNLEPEARLGDARESDHWQQWLWMKNYRVWEANRKVFLYPENWIEPDLRDDKSPFFKDLENELLQDEVTQERVERAYTNYFIKLDDVDRLDVRGLYEEVKESGKKVLHVIGCSFSEYPVYYYRKRTSNRVWTAWEKIDLGIEGDHVIPVVHKGRLLLYWPKFTEFGPDTNKRWEISLVWSEYKANTWQATKVGKNKLIRPKLNLEDFAFRFDEEGPRIWVYEQVHLKAPSGLVPDSYSVGSSGFSLNLCNGDLDVFTITPAAPSQSLLAQRILVHPKGTDAASMRFAEEDPAEYRLLINQPIAIDEITGYLATLPQLVTDLAEAGLGGIFLAIILAGAASEVLNQITGIQRQVREEALLEDTRSLNIEEEEFKLLPAHQFRQFATPQPFFLDIESRSYLASPRWQKGHAGSKSPSLSLYSLKYRFEPFYHPYFCELVKRFNEAGVEGILNAPAADFRVYRQLYKEGQRYNAAGQLLPYPDPPLFSSFRPTGHVWQNVEDPHSPYPYEQFDFSVDGSFSIYNWELFFHVPLLAADRMSKNQRFEEAQRWFHFIFDPTDVSVYLSPAKYWKVKPLFEVAQQWEEPVETLEDMLHRLAIGNLELSLQVEQWRNNPFNPHLIARLRLVAYMKTVVQKYLDNLIAWGDYLFQQDTMESINEATQLYILASEILGPRPLTISREETAPLTYAAVESSIDAYSNFLVDIETGLPPVSLPSPGSLGSEIPPDLVLYFCIPFNEKLASYWDMVADRLFKVRHCMNLEGQVRQLALFSPPIDPALLVRARAMGLDLGDVIGNALELRLPHHRYQYLAQKALECCNEVRSLGGALLAALEKKDAEDLALLRSRQEVSMLKLVKLVKDQQIEEANETLQGLQASRKLAEKRLEFYSNREFMSPGELNHTNQMHEAHKYETLGGAFNLAASIAYVFPDILIQGPASGISFGGSHVGRALSAIGQQFGFIASQYSFEATMASAMAGYQRRQDDWDLQTELANKEINQIDKQILAAEIRLAIAAQDKANHEKQIEQTEETEVFMKTKFTNAQLYSWMVSQISALYYQAYRMAYELAQKAEKAARHELGVEPGKFRYLQFGTWDSLRKGLLAGERLHQDLRRMEIAYLEQNRREFELTKHISLALLNPHELLKLRETGKCTLAVPEELFDLDFPGHYYRRIKSVSISLPCVVGPYTTIACTLRLLKNRVRINTSGTTYPHSPDADDSRFINTNIPVKAIALSHAQHDSGVFELNFRDERYLPFEGAGVISAWSLELFHDNSTDAGKSLRQFDYGTISDAILHIKYTAREAEDTGTFKNNAISNLKAYFSLDGTSPSLRMFNLRHDFPNQWHRFLHPASPTDGNVFEFEMSPKLFVSRDKGNTLNVNSVWVLAQCANKEIDYAVILTPLLFEPAAPAEEPPAEENRMTLSPQPVYGGLHFGQRTVRPGSGIISPTASAVTWQVRMTRSDGSNLLAAEVENLILILGYAWEM